MQVITYDQAIAAAREIEAHNQVRPVETPTADIFCEHIKTYFPEFERFEHLLNFYFLRHFEGGVFEYAGDGVSSSDGEPEVFVFSIERAAQLRPDMYASWFSYCEDAVADELFDLLSFGHEPLSDRETIVKACHDLVSIWSDFRFRWFLDLGKMKVGGSSDIVDAAKEAGIDISVNSYFEGVPVEYLAGSNPPIPF